jgi:hypothetical protein
MTVSSGHSSNVRLVLLVGGQTLEVEQVLRDRCLLAEPVDHPPCEGEFVMHVDGRRRAWRVRLPEGISKERREIRLV